MANMDRLVQFHPTDEQLFAHFLSGKASGAPLPPNPIEERDIYGHDPWEIFDAASDRTFYVFTTLRKNKSRVLRTAGSEKWKEQLSLKITNGDGEVVGHKRSFKFKGGHDSSATNGRWIMYKFSMCDETQCEHVLCKFKCHKDEKKLENEAIIISDDSTVQFKDGNQRVKKALPSYTAGQARPSIGPLSTMSTAIPSPYPEWAKQLKNMEISPLVKYRFCTVLKDRARALHARNNLIESNPGRVLVNLPDIRRIDELHLLNCN